MKEQTREEGNRLRAELLKPRYKVIADYPGNTLPIGEVLEQDMNNQFWAEDGFEYFLPKTLDKYPHLFKMLKWHEERKLEEMPEYVKDTFGNVVKCYYKEIAGKLLCYDVQDDEFPYKWKCIQPATEQEYLEYQKQYGKQ